MYGKWCTVSCHLYKKELLFFQWFNVLRFILHSRNSFQKISIFCVVRVLITNIYTQQRELQKELNVACEKTVLWNIICLFFVTCLLIFKCTKRLTNLLLPEITKFHN